MEPVVDNSTAYRLREAKSHPEDHLPRAPELGEGTAEMVLTWVSYSNYKYYLVSFILNNITLITIVILVFLLSKHNNFSNMEVAAILDLFES